MELGDNPIVGRTDPATSAEAAGRVNSSGTRRANAGRVLGLVRANPGATSVMLWHAQKGQPGAMDRHEVSRRLADLMHKGLASQGDVRVCAVKGTPMVSWWPVPWPVPWPAGPTPATTSLFDGV